MQTDGTQKLYFFKGETGSFLETILTGVFERLAWTSYAVDENMIQWIACLYWYSAYKDGNKQWRLQWKKGIIDELILRRNDNGRGFVIRVLD